MNLKHLTAFLSIVCLPMFAETVNLDKPEDFGQLQGAFKDGVFSYPNCWRFVMAKKFNIDPTSHYRLLAEFNGPDGNEKSGNILIGFVCYDIKGREIQFHEVNYMPNTQTELAVPVAAGDTSIKVKDASKWRKGTFASIAFNAQENLKDLPNRDVLISCVKDIIAKNGLYEIVLKKPIQNTYPAGTKVREHQWGGSSLPAVTGKLSPKWINGKSGFISGVGAGVSSNQWWPGTKSVTIYFSVAPKNIPAKFRNIKLEMKQINDVF